MEGHKNDIVSVNWAFVRTESMMSVDFMQEIHIFEQ